MVRHEIKKSLITRQAENEKLFLNSSGRGITQQRIRW